jgi:hypothetical protein
MLALLLFFISLFASSDSFVATGSQPQVALDYNGVIRVVFGRADSIFCSSSTDTGETFSDPVLVGHISGMHLGMTRGPQIASSSRYTIITAMDKAGNIHFFELSNTDSGWTYKGLVNDVPDTAPEGLMSITADANDNFYAVWLDIRIGRHNNIFFASLSGEKPKWTKNRMIYQSPDGHVCECCKPGIAVNGSRLALMYRNWLNGSRDLYMSSSENGGQTFDASKKLGNGTWKLDGCPMDGGGITIDDAGQIHTVWQREGAVYYCRPGQPEINLGNGKICSFSSGLNNDKIFIAMQHGGEVKIADFNNRESVTIGKGVFLKSVTLPGNKILCAWEQGNQIKVRKM